MQVLGFWYFGYVGLGPLGIGCPAQTLPLSAVPAGHVTGVYFVVTHPCPFSSLFSGSSLSILSTVCASCSSSLGFVLTSIFGTGLGVSLSAFVSNYQTSQLILPWSWYSISKSLSTKRYCALTSNSNPKNNDNSLLSLYAYSCLLS